LWHGLNSLPETWLFLLFFKVPLLICENGYFSFSPKHALDNYSILLHICTKHYYFATSEHLFSSLFSLIVVLQNFGMYFKDFLFNLYYPLHTFLLFRLDNFGPVNLWLPWTHSNTLRTLCFHCTFRNTVFRSQLKSWQYITISMWYVFVIFSMFVWHFELILDSWEFHEHTYIFRNIFPTRLFW
jgi:hypothetical protein